ncbi:MAG: hypothetical protein QXV84_02895 [Conexivisphaerales archaeon]
MESEVSELQEAIKRILEADYAVEMIKVTKYYKQRLEGVLKLTRRSTGEPFMKDFSALLDQSGSILAVDLDDRRYFAKQVI